MKAFFAIVYELCLDGDCVAKDDPLYETSYIGQAGRYSSSPEEALEMRWQGHQQDARKHPKEVGLKWALEKYGPGAFSKRVICFLKFEKRCVEALDYMNAVEMEEIDCRGGIMQDIDPPSAVFQTFNLAIGGQGCPVTRFANMQAKEELAWQRFQDKVLELVASTGTCLCRSDATLPCGYGVGQALANVRNRRNFVVGVEGAAEREKWLEDLPGWTWESRETDRWTTFEKELVAHVEEFGTAYVRYHHVSPSGYKLGSHVSNVRQGAFLGSESGKERTEWLNTLPGWTWNAKGSSEARKIQGAASSNSRKDPVIEQRRIEKQSETAKRKREEHWATLNEVELAEAKRLFEWQQNGAAKKKARREARARGEAPKPKKPPQPKTDAQIRGAIRVQAKIADDLAALRATLVPKASQNQISRFRKDGTVAKAHQILRERSVDAGV